jgi:hypothetical protein
MASHASTAEDLPALYRVILDRVGLLERAGARSEAGRIRVAATRAYSTAWDDVHLRRLERLADRAALALAELERAPEARPPVADRRRRRWPSPGLG